MVKNILSLNHKDAKIFFLSREAFSNIELPPYFSFNEILLKIDKNFTQKELSSQDLDKAKKISTVNHILYGNKDGKYAWRKFQIINPLIYVSLVNLITEKNNWEFLRNRFKEFQKISNIQCESLPVISRKNRKQKAEQISQWVTNIEKKSISRSLEYKFLYHTDISNCYSSIYTHSISWAIHTKKIAKSKRSFNDLFGNKIDHHLQAMAYGQTNGIPEGSMITDFIAEIILGYADYELAEKLNSNPNNKKYHILRYRDDYRIFVNDISYGDEILKKLSEILLDLGFRLNTNKTFFNQDVVGGSIKENKLDSLKFELVPKELSENELLRHLLIIHYIGKKFPNSGILKNRLSKIFKVVKPSSFKNQELLLTSILVDIAYDNPNCFSLIASLLSCYLPKLSEKKQKYFLEQIKNKICTLTNIGLLEVWIQRIALGLKLKLEFNEVLCKFVYNDHNQKLFETNWIENKKIKGILDRGSYIKKSIISKIKPKIDQSEIQIFTYEN